MIKFIKDLTVDYQNIVLILIIIVGAFITAKTLRWLIDKSFDTTNDKLNVDATRYKFFKNAVSLIVWITAFAAIISLIPRLRTFAISLFAGAGIFVAIIGFAAQQAFANIIGGIFIVLFKPFRIGDRIKVGDNYYGIVEDITLRHTVILNYENKRIVIPNSIISSETIINETIIDTKICRFIEFGISYDSDVELATEIIRKASEEHPYSIDNRTIEEFAENEPIVPVRLVRFDDSSVVLRAYVWTDNPEMVFRMHYEINKEVKKQFDNQGVEIPFPYRTIVYKNDLPKNSKLKNE